MKLSAVTLAPSSGTYQTTSTPKIKTPKHQNINTESGFPSFFYMPVSFKANKKSSEFQILENKLKKFYDKEKGSDLRKISARFPDYELTNSRFINNNFNNIIKEKIEQAKHNKKVKENDILTALQKGIFSANYHLHTQINNENISPDEIIAASKKEAERILNEIKSHGNITFPVEKDSEKYRKIIFAIQDEVDKLYSSLPNINHRFISRMFLNSFQESIQENIYPVFDEELFNELKDVLTKEPFTSFNTQALKAEIQRNQNKISANAAAQDIYNDSIKHKISPFENKKLYNFLSQNNENLDYLLENLYGYTYSQINTAFNESKINKKHKVLLVDPGVYARFEEFVNFVKEKNINTEALTPVDLRKKFSDYLGTETIYRGLYTPEPQKFITQLKKEGNFASIYQNPTKTISAIKYYISNEDGVANTIFGRISGKIKYPSDKSEFLSASSVYDIAASVQKLSGDPESPVVVIKAEVPKLSLIKQKGLFENQQNSAVHKTLKIGNKYFPYDTKQQEIEIFIPFHLPVEKAEYIIDTNTSNFEWT